MPDEESDSHMYYDLTKTQKPYSCKAHTNVIKTGYDEKNWLIAKRQYSTIGCSHCAVILTGEYGQLKGTFSAVQLCSDCEVGLV